MALPPHGEGWGEATRLTVNNSKINIFHLLILTLCLAATTQLLISCANIGSPDGGLYDEEPPRVTKTSPAYGSINAKDRKITINFNEYIKLENAMEKVIISPPQLEQPEINASGKKVTVELKDSLKPDMTYTIDFGNSIVDNNEGNPMSSYAFTFSTGKVIDSLQVAGTVLNAENLEPIKGMLVGLYRIPDSAYTDSTAPLASALPDSIFRTKPLERIGRTDGSGRFVIKGVADGYYRIYALGDQDQNFCYTQKSEMVAFTDEVIHPYVRYETRHDTIWHDSIHYDSIFPVKYYHYYPDNVVLRAYSLPNTDRYLMKSERPELHFFSLIFSAGSDTLPRITGLNFECNDSTFVIDPTSDNDSITYWIRDSLVYNIDTLTFRVDYFATDTLGGYTLKSDTLELTSKLTKERMAKNLKSKQEEWEKQKRREYKAEKKKKEAEEEAAWEAEEAERAAAEGRKPQKRKKEKKKKDDEEDEFVVPPMPDPLLEVKDKFSTSLAPDKNLDFEAAEPIAYIDTSKIHFEAKKDTLFFPEKYIMRRRKGTVNSYRLYAEWLPDSSYQLVLDTGAFVSIYGKLSEGSKKNIKVRSLDTFSSLFVVLHGADTSAVVQLLNQSDKVIKSLKAKNGRADFYFVQPQTCYMRVFYDRNGNGIWDPGDYDSGTQPEELYYFPSSLVLRAKWDIQQDWTPTATPLERQKPEKITKQKPDKVKEIQHRNAEKLAERARRKNKKK